MNKDVYIEITGLQRSPDGTEDVLRTKARGNYYVKENYQYVLFQERIGDGQGEVKTRLKISEDCVELYKSGDVEWEAMFKTGVAYMSKYRTPYGPISMETRTDILRKMETDNQIVIQIQYELYSCGEALAHCEMKIDITNK